MVGVWHWTQRGRFGEARRPGEAEAAEEYLPERSGDRGGAFLARSGPAGGVCGEGAVQTVRDAIPVCFVVAV